MATHSNILAWKKKKKTMDREAWQATVLREQRVRRD